MSCCGNAQFEGHVLGTRAPGDSWSQSSKAVQPSSTETDDSSSLGDAGGDGHRTVSLGSMQAIDGLGVRCLPYGSTSKHAKSTRGGVSQRKISTLKARENTHPGTRASGASSQELSAQLAGETCSVIDVGDCYPA